VENFYDLISDVMATAKPQVVVTVIVFFPSSRVFLQLKTTVFPLHALHLYTCIKLFSLFSRFAIELKAVERIDLVFVLCM
jgi:hypothetical protein